MGPSLVLGQLCQEQGMPLLLMLIGTFGCCMTALATLSVMLLLLIQHSLAAAASAADHGVISVTCHFCCVSMAVVKAGGLVADA